MKMFFKVMFFIGLVASGGCACRRTHYYITDTDLTLQGSVRTENRYWIKSVIGWDNQTYARDFPEYERQYPQVFDPAGIPVTVELSGMKYDWGTGKNMVSIGFTLCTALIVPQYKSSSKSQTVEVSLDVASGKSQRFKTHCRYQYADSLWPTAYLAAIFFDDIKDVRFAQDWYGSAFDDETRSYAWRYGDEPAIVLATAYALMEFEKRDRNIGGNVRIGN